MNRRGFLKFLGIGVAVAKAGVLNKLAAPELTVIKSAGAAPELTVIKSAGYSTIGGWVSYKFHQTVTLPPATGLNSQRIRFIDSVPASGI